MKEANRSRLGQSVGGRRVALVVMAALGIALSALGVSLATTTPSPSRTRPTGTKSGPGGTAGTNAHFGGNRANASQPAIAAPGQTGELVGVVGNGAMTFPTPTSGWYVAGIYPRAALYHTSNGGATWALSLQDKYVGTEVYFEDSENGWITGSPAGMLHTANGGASWQGLTNSNGGPQSVIFDLTFSSATAGYGISAMGQVYTTSDAGAIWKRDAFAPPNVTHMCQADGAGWVSTLSGVFKTTDNGIAWVKSVTSPVGTEGNTTTVGCSGSMIWSLFNLGGGPGHVGSSFVLSISGDAGTTWNNAIVSNDSGLTPAGPSFPAGSIATKWVTSSGGALTLFDNFSPVSSGPSPCITELRSMDDGNQFTTSLVYEGAASINAEWFSSAMDGWLAVVPSVGAARTVVDVYTTTNGGQSWTASGKISLVS